MSSIEWTEKTWNPTVGCSKVSAGCQNCYAINQAYRNAAIGQKLAEQGKNAGRLAYYDGLTEKRGERVEWTGAVKFVPEALDIPLKTRKPTKFFVNSMSDLFHESVSDEQLDKIFAVMALAEKHVFQVLTKRPQRMVEYFSKTPSEGNYPAGFETQYNIEYHANGMADSAEKSIKLPLPNVWLGVTCENQKAADERIPLLQKVPAAVRFVSFEPLLEKVSISPEHHFQDIDWAIIGGESGNKARPCQIEWILDLLLRCQDYGVTPFVKQIGSKPLLNNKKFNSQGKGNDIDSWPDVIKVRRFPKAKIPA